MRIEQSFTVSASVDTVWEMFQDVPAISRCLPGAQLEEDLGGGRYAGRMNVRLGPITVGLEGEAAVAPDAVERRATIEGRGVDRRGGSRGQVRVTYRLEPLDGATRVAIEADLTLAGPAAQFGRVGLVEELSRRLIGEFVACLEARLAAAPGDEGAAAQAADVRAIPLLIDSLGASVRKRFGRS